MLDKNFFVYKASAGAGKTYTLVKSYITLCISHDEPSYYKHILAITFTNKAASEMRHRVIQTLKHWSGDEELTGGNLTMLNAIVDELQIDQSIVKLKAKAIFKHMLHHYDTIAIKTIDKFTTQIVRTFAHDLGLPTNFNLEIKTDNLVQEAVMELMTHAGKNTPLGNYLGEFSLERVNEDKSYSINAELINTANLLFKENNYALLDSLKNISIESVANENKLLAEQNENTSNKVKTYAKQFLQILKNNNLLLEDFSYGKNGIAGQISSLANEKSNVDLNKFLSSQNVQKTIASDQWYAKDKEKNIANAIETCLPDIRKVVNELYQYALQININYNSIDTILKNKYAFYLLSFIQDFVAQQKKENNIALLSEFNEAISKVVSNEPAPYIYERIGEKFKHFLIDEFQDTSLLQFFNLLPLIDNSLAQAQYNMLVGDAKQAIYRFRGGDAQLLSNLPNINFIATNHIFENYQNSIERNFNNQQLNTNYRSKYEVILFNNLFFENCKSLLHQNVQIYYDAHQQKYNENNKGGFVEGFAIVEANEKDLIDQAKEYTLNCIYNCINDNFSYSDICILVYKNKTASEIAEYLIANQIPVESAEALWLGKSNAINFIIQFLSLTKNPNDAIAIQSIIHYLATIKFSYINHAEIDKSKLEQKLNQGIENKQSFEEILQFAHIELSINELNALPIYDSAQSVINYFNLLQYDTSYVLTLSNLLWQKTIIDDYNWAAFLNYYNEDGYRFPVTSNANKNAVKITTIHKSKGLEFPVVILPITTKNNVNSFKKLAHINTNNFTNQKVAYIDINKSLKETIFEADYKQEKILEQADDINTLYVAFTRAVNRLYFSFSNKEVKSSNADEDDATITLKKIVKHSMDELHAYKIVEGSNTYYRIGELKNYETKTQVQLTENVIQASNTNKAWYNYLQIGKKYSVSHNTMLNEYVQFGIIVHDVLARIQSLNDLPNCLNELQNDGSITLAVSLEIQNIIHQLWNSSHVDEWKNAQQVWSEHELLSADKKIIRPDKVILYENNIVVYDFKTGNPTEEAKLTYHQQVKNYVTILATIYPEQVCSGKIIYLNNETIYTENVLLN